jgi:hypothetical protein
MINILLASYLIISIYILNYIWTQILMRLSGKCNILFNLVNHKIKISIKIESNEMLNMTNAWTNFFSIMIITYFRHLKMEINQF